MAAVETVMSARGADGRPALAALETFGADGHAVEALRRSITAGNVEESGRAQGKIEPLKSRSWEHGCAFPHALRTSASRS